MENSNIEEIGNKPIRANVVSEEKTNELIEKFEGFAMTNHSNSLDYSRLNDGQVDKVLDIMKLNEENAYKFHCKKLETIQSIKEKEISSTTSSQRTLRITFVCTLVAIFIITILILLYKDNYFMHWITFLGGNLSGIGLSKIGTHFGSSNKSITSENKNSSEGENE